MYKAETNSHEKLTSNQGPARFPGPGSPVWGATGGASQETLAVDEGIGVCFDFPTTFDFFNRLEHCATQVVIKDICCSLPENTYKEIFAFNKPFKQEHDLIEISFFSTTSIKKS